MYLIFAALYTLHCTALWAGGGAAGGRHQGRLPPAGAGQDPPAQYIRAGLVPQDRPHQDGQDDARPRTIPGRPKHLNVPKCLEWRREIVCSND